MHLIKGNRKIKKKFNSKSPYSVSNDFTIYTLAKQLAFINQEHITSIGELEGKLSQTKQAYEKAKTELNTLLKKQEQLTMVIEHCEQYFLLKGKSDISSAEKLRLQIYEQTVQRIRAESESDLESVRQMKISIDEKCEKLHSDFRVLESQYKVYADIADTYYKISKGDYISNLIAEKQKETEQEKKHNKSLV